jgi:hypothetical protein
VIKWTSGAGVTDIIMTKMIMMGVHHPEVEMFEKADK